VVRPKEDIQGKSYHTWEIYSVERTFVEDPIDRQRIRSRMMWVLTGDEKYSRVMMSLGVQ